MKLNLKYSSNRFVATPTPKTEAKVKAAPKKAAKKTEAADK